MKLSGIREAYEELSGKLSDIVRQLAFAGIGIIWIVSLNKPDSTVSISRELTFPLILLVFTLFLDALQYLVSTAIWYSVYHKHHKKGANEDTEINEKEAWNIPSWVIFIAKVLVLFTSYVLLFIYLWKILF